jgi:hypothetical protein
MARPSSAVACDRPTGPAIPTTFITDLNVGYKLTSKIRFDVGANNLFDKQAPTMPLRPDGSRPYVNNVYNAPLSNTLGHQRWLLLRSRHLQLLRPRPSLPDLARRCVCAQRRVFIGGCHE